MRGTLIIGILLSILITIFALSNNEDITINYLFGKGTIVKPLLIFILLAIGAIITLLFSIPSWLKNRKIKAALKKENAKLTKEIGDLRNQVLTTKQSVHTDSYTNESYITDVDTEI